MVQRRNSIASRREEVFVGECRAFVLHCSILYIYIYIFHYILITDPYIYIYRERERDYNCVIVYYSMMYYAHSEEPREANSKSGNPKNIAVLST